jgi:hypothetical protein
MKKKSLLLTAVAMLGLTAATMAQTVPSYVPTNGIAGWWPFNGNANDESGNGNNGTVNGATLTTDRLGNVNKAYSFDGVNNKIEVPNSTILNFGVNPTFSINFWINKNTATAGGIISKAIPLNGFSWVGFNFVFDDFQIGYPCLSNIINTGTNSWNCLTFTIQNGLIKGFLNGVLINQFTCNQIVSNSISNTNNLYFGVDRDGNNYYNGLIDDIGIWNRALTQQEITDLYNGCQLSINTQPTSQQININNNAQFIVGSSDPSATFQWQTDLGVGFQNLTSVGQYSGTTNDTLTVANVSLSNNNQPFRCIISSGSCSDTSNVAVLTVNNNVGIHEFTQDNLFSVYPNPAQTVINVNADSKLVGESYSVIDNTGRVVLTGKITSENTIIEFGSLSNGVYMFNVANNMKQQFKILKH